MNAQPSQTHREHVTVQKETNVIMRMNISSLSAALIQTVITTTETWTGLIYSDALPLCTSSESSILNGVTRNYLGSAKLTIGSGGTSIWNTKEACWGKKVASQLSQIGDTNLYFVSRTTTEYGVTNNGGTLELL